MLRYLQDDGGALRPKAEQRSLASQDAHVYDVCAIYSRQLPRLGQLA